MDSMIKELMGQCPQNFWARTAPAIPKPMQGNVRTSEAEMLLYILRFC